MALFYCVCDVEVGSKLMRQDFSHAAEFKHPF